MKVDDWEQHAIFGLRRDIDPDMYLFHYTSIGSAASIALSQAFALGPLNAMNDPREFQIRQVTAKSSSLGARGTGPVSERERRKFEERLEVRRSRVRIGCFTRDRIEGSPSSAYREDRRGYAHSRMWTQYASLHQGVCLVFDRRCLISQCEDAVGSNHVTCGDVQYIDGFDPFLAKAETADFDHPDPNGHHVQHVVPSLFHKNADWASELEYRLVVDDWEEAACLVPLGRALVGIVLGLSYPQYQLRLAESMASAFNLSHNVAAIVVNSGVLQAWPAQDRNGRLQRWTDAQTRTREAFW